MHVTDDGNDIELQNNLSIFQGMDWQQARSLFHVLFEMLPDGVVLVDMEHPDNVIVDCNTAFAQMNGYKPNELIGQSIHILHTKDPDTRVLGGTLPQEARPMPSTTSQNADEHRGDEHRGDEHRGDERARAVHRRKDGTLFLVEFVSTIVNIGGQKLTLGVDRDISDHERVAAITKSEQALRAIFDYSPDGIVLIDPNDWAYTIFECNDAYCRMNGYTREELLGRPISILDVNSEEARAVGLHMLESDEQVVYPSEGVPVAKQELHTAFLNPHTWHRRKDGIIYPIEYASTVVLVDGRKMVLGIDRDITARRRMEHLNHDRNRVLELIARDAPLVESLGYITHLLHNQFPAMHSLILSLHEGRAQYEVSSLDVEEYRRQRVVNGILLNAGNTPQSAEFRDAVDLLNIENSASLRQLAQHGHGWSRDVLEQQKTPETDRLLTVLGAAGSVWIVPITGAEKILGALVMWSSPTHRDSGATLHDAVEVASRSAAIALEQSERSQRLAHQAEHDVLTGLPNRLLFEDRLAQALVQARRNNAKTALMFLDLDGFKRINDTLGHRAGDIVLQEVARRLKNCMRESDTVTRIGGDEFTIVLRDLQEYNDAALVAGKIITAIQAPFLVFNHEMYVTISIGIAIAPDDADDVGTLMRYADAAMYRAKDLGKGRFEFYEEGLGRMLDGRMELKTRLRQAFSNDEFELYYQPQIELAGGRLAGVEALIRWKHPTLGTLLPISFIPAAEENGLILKIGEWVINRACDMLMQLQRDATPNKLTPGFEAPPKVAVNISAVQLGQQDFFDIVKAALDRSQLPPERLELELTESVVMHNMEEATRHMQRLQDLGVRLSLDDFGMGYSSLSYLHKLPVQALKIDRSFVSGIERDASAQALVKSIVTLGHNLELQIVSEGIETTEELSIIRELGCDIVQGFYTGHPMATDLLMQWLNKHSNDAF